MGCCTQLSICRFGSCLTKNLISALKIENALFMGQNEKSAYVALLAIPRATRVSDMAAFQKTMP
jgi:hypothetical protein